MLERPEIGWIERTGYLSCMQEENGFCEDGSGAFERQTEQEGEE